MGDAQGSSRQPNGRVHLHLRPNMVVEALFEDFLKPQNNAFFDGVLLKEVQDGVYHVRFLDGDEDDNCPEWKLRPINAVQFGLLPDGCDVRALWDQDNMYYDAKVVQANPSTQTYDVQFNDDHQVALGVSVNHLRYSSAFSKLDDIHVGMIVLVQWTLTTFAPGRVVAKCKEGKTCHVQNLDYYIEHCSLPQLTRVYGYVSPYVLGEPDETCSKCRLKGGGLTICDWCKQAYHVQCAPTPVAGVKPWFCSHCVDVDKSRPRRQELHPLKSIYHQDYASLQQVAQQKPKRGLKRTQNSRTVTARKSPQKVSTERCTVKRQSSDRVDNEGTPKRQRGRPRGRNSSQDAVPQ